MNFRDLKVGMYFRFIGLAENHPAHNTACVKTSPLMFTFMMDPNAYAARVHKGVFCHKVISYPGSELKIQMQARAAIGVALL